MGWYDDRGGMMYGSGYAIFGLLIMVLFISTFVWLIIKIVGHGSDSSRHQLSPHQEKASSQALDHLNMRLAKGEISPEEYTTIKSHLSGS